MNVLDVINLLRWTLIVQTLLGCVLCASGVQTAILDLVTQAEHGQNGRKKLATEMWLRMEKLLALAFLGLLIVGIFFTTPITEVTEANWWRMVGARALFNVCVFCLLSMKAVGYFGRKRINAYDYANLASGVNPAVARERLLAAAESQRLASLAQGVATEAQAEASKALGPGEPLP